MERKDCSYVYIKVMWTELSDFTFQAKPIYSIEVDVRERQRFRIKRPFADHGAESAFTSLKLYEVS